MKVLAGDIGGTNTRIIFADLYEKDRRIIAQKNYPSANFTSIDQVLENFINENHITTNIDAACFAVAGTVKSGVAAVTNLPWVVQENKLSSCFQIPKVKLINDFIAVVYGIEELNASDTLTLQQGEVNDSSNQPNAVVIGAGTGLGVAHRVWMNDHYAALSTEAGHVGFAPENEQQCQLLQWLQKKQSHVSLEMILSGRGLLIIYNFLQEQQRGSQLNSTLEAMKTNDPAQVITEYAISNNDELCLRTLECFIDIYGSAAGNAALHVYPVDEVYIAGGIGARIKDKLQEKRFMDAFKNKGLMTSNMEKIKIKLILNENIGLYGALQHLSKNCT